MPPKQADLSHLIPPPPFGPASQKCTVTSRGFEPETNATSKPLENSILPHLTGRDIVALIFLLLMVPQGLSCLVLSSYILLSTFKATAAKTIAKYFVKTPESDYDVEEQPLLRNRFYRSELVGDMLQLFSINLFILLICHYTMPKPWLQGLVVLAKSIVASSLVGTYTTGSTTYVSVVASTSTSSTTTSTTTTSGQTKSESKYLTSNFLNSLLGFGTVVALNNFVGNFLVRLNVRQILGDLARLYRTEPSHGLSYDKIMHVLRTLVALLPSKGQYIIDSTRVFKSNLISRFILHVLINHLGLGGRSILSLSLVLRECAVVINYAYLVLCIHVISLTVSPFLKRIVLFKDYSRTLDHLAALTPSVPYGRVKSVTSVPRENDSVVVLNVEQQQKPSPHVLNVESAIAKSTFTPSVAPVVANNFNIFCMVPATRAAQLGSKTSHNRTIVDRKRSNSNATPSTTIMDRYFSVSVQPLWSWLAAVKVLATFPTLFGGPPTRVKNNGMPFVTIPYESELPLAVAHVGACQVVLEVLDETYLDVECFKVYVNGIEWRQVSMLVGKRETDTEPKANEENCHRETKENGLKDNEENPRSVSHTDAPSHYKSDNSAHKSDSGPHPESLYVNVYGLAPLSQYEIDMYAPDLVAHQVVCTTDGNLCVSQSSSVTPLELLQYTLKYTIIQLERWKAYYKKAKKEENKKNTEMKRQIDLLRTKIDKVGTKHTTEAKTGGKLRGLQNSVAQLENEIQDLHLQSQRLDQVGDEDYKAEESQLASEIAQLEQYIAEHEALVSKMKNTLKGVEAERDAVQAKKKKVEDKLEARKEDIAKQNGEIKALKRTVVGKLQKRQKRILDKMAIVPRVEEATEALEGHL